MGRRRPACAGRGVVYQYATVGSVVFGFACSIYFTIYCVVCGMEGASALAFGAPRAVLVVYDPFGS